MLVPVRCFTCGKPIGHLWEEYQKKVKKEGPEKTFKGLGMDRYCCRRMFLSHKDYINEIIKYKTR